MNESFRDVLEQRHNHYKLKAGDTIAIKLYNRPGDLNQVASLVLPDGRSDLFFMDAHIVAGKTVSELEAELRARTITEVRDPEVSIQVAPSEETAYFVGEFLRPGPVVLTTKMTLHEAIAMVGGPRITGDTDWALLRRPFRDPSRAERFRIDLNDDSEGIFLLPGDQVILGRTFLAGVSNYLREYIFNMVPGASQIATGAAIASF
ncbi:MAG TPA: polysaccharide biosynthesis/export family protein [Planctomycetota bacterium]|nr:polysaccharide biosynthesis/export family protein [Planctomycetota bacterium]